MRQAFLCFLILAVQAVVSHGQANTWKMHKSMDGNFIVLLPGEPRSISKTVNGVEGHALYAQEKPALYTVIYDSSIPEHVANDISFAAYKEGVFEEIPICRVGPEMPSLRPVNGYISHSYRLSCSTPQGKGAAVATLYYGKHYAYALMVMYPLSGPDPAGMKKFFESFNVIDPRQ